MKAVVFGVLFAALLTAIPAWAEGANQVPVPQARELIYCADLMSHAERAAYRAKMQAAQSPKEKAALRDAHRQEMRRRAQARGS